MKIIHVSFCFYPDSVGGTEVYVESLCQNLKNLGIDTIICAPADRKSEYFYRGIKVRRYPLPSTVCDLSELYGEGDTAAAKEVEHVLDEENPSLMHLHAFTRGVSLRIVHEAKRRRIPVAFTYHTPTVSCQRGNLMRWGREVCDGKLDLDLCTSCTLNGLGLPRPMADVIGRFPVSSGSLLGKINLSGGLWTALRMREMVHLRHSVLRNLLHEVDFIVVLCQWTHDLLIQNDILPEKILLSRQGLNLDGVHHDSPQKKSLEDPKLKIAFLGRLHPTKGIHVLIQAIRNIPTLPLSLDIYGVTQDPFSVSYLTRLKDLAGNDRRIIFKDSISNEKVKECIGSYDLVAVPSQWLETGPLVVLEAFASGVPVIGSDMGGIAELVEHGVNGWLVQPESVWAWSEALRRICEDRELLVKLRQEVQPPRRMEEVAKEMVALYELVLQGKRL